MNDITSLKDTIVPKTDQLNSDDLLTGPITVRVESVSRGSTAEQPLSLKISGGHQPYKPCKIMRRVLIAAWGDNGKNWIGKSLTLFSDPDVLWGGVKVGGIRISALSDIPKDMDIALSISKAKRVLHKVKKLTPPTQTEAPAATTKKREPWPDDKFDKKLASALPKLQSGETSKASFITMLQGPGDLTPSQLAKIEAVELNVPAEKDAFYFADEDANDNNF